MKYSLFVVLAVFFCVAPVFGQIAESATHSMPAQLVGVEVTSGHHLSAFIVMKGNVNIQDNAQAKFCNVFINSFSTKVMPDGTWALAFPKSSLYDKGTKIQVIAVQDFTNIMAQKEFDLTNLDKTSEKEHRFEKLHK